MKELCSIRREQGRESNLLYMVLYLCIVWSQTGIAQWKKLPVVWTSNIYQKRSMESVRSKAFKSVWTRSKAFHWKWKRKRIIESVRSKAFVRKRWIKSIWVWSKAFEVNQKRTKAFNGKRSIQSIQKRLSSIKALNRKHLFKSVRICLKAFEFDQKRSSSIKSVRVPSKVFEFDRKHSIKSLRSILDVWTTGNFFHCGQERSLLILLQKNIVIVFCSFSLSRSLTSQVLFFVQVKSYKNIERQDSTALQSLFSM